jgi:predicted DNA-binding transcriptional regulator AlpA
VIRQPTNQIAPRGLRLPDAAAYVGMGQTKFMELVKAGRLPNSTKIDNVTLWDKKALDRALDEIFDSAQDDPYARVEA